VLKYLGLNGEQHITSIQKNLELNYATAHRSITRLCNLNLIWLSNHDNNKPKSPKYYSLTPYGIVELFLRGEIEEENKENIINKWKKHCPCYILYWKEIKDEGLLNSILKILYHIYPKTVTLYNINKRIMWHEGPNSLIIHKNILDMVFIYQLFENKDININMNESDYIKIIYKDKYFKGVWIRYYWIKSMIFDNIKSINEEYFKIKIK
jgi:predicted transcriptional regulator